MTYVLGAFIFLKKRTRTSLYFCLRCRVKLLTALKKQDVSGDAQAIWDVRVGVDGTKINPCVSAGSTEIGAKPLFHLRKLEFI